MLPILELCPTLFVHITIAPEVLIEATRLLEAWQPHTERATRIACSGVQTYVHRARPVCTAAFISQKKTVGLGLTRVWRQTANYPWLNFTWVECRRSLKFGSFGGRQCQRDPNARRTAAPRFRPILARLVPLPAHT